MKLLNKLAIVAAMSLSANVMAMEALEDEALSAATGQDGITLKVFSPGIEIEKLFLHDNDGIGAAGGYGIAANANTAGAIIANDVKISKHDPVNTLTTPLATIKIDTDGGSGTDSSGATLNANVKLAATDISIGSIGVGKSRAAPDLTDSTASVRRGVEANEQVILSNIGLTLGATDLNVQLGNQPQGAMIVLDGTVTGGVVINGLTLNDNDGLNGQAAPYGGAAAGVAGTLTLGTVKIVDANSANLTASARINIDQNLGLAVTLSNARHDVYVQGIELGNTPSMGDMEIQGMYLGGTTLFVHGH